MPGAARERERRITFVTREMENARTIFQRRCLVRPGLTAPGEPVTLSTTSPIRISGTTPGTRTTVLARRLTVCVSHARTCAGCTGAHTCAYTCGCECVYGCVAARVCVCVCGERPAMTQEPIFVRAVGISFPRTDPLESDDLVFIVQTAAARDGARPSIYKRLT